MNIDYKVIGEESADKHSLTYMTIKNHELFQQGNYNVEILQCLGFLFCKHHDRQTRMDEFWQVVNPDIDQECLLERVLVILKIFIYVAIVLRLKIEKSKAVEDQSQQAIEYLQKLKVSSFSLDDVTDEAVCQLLGLQQDQKIDGSQTLNYHELFQLVNPEKCLTTFGIRMTIL